MDKHRLSIDGMSCAGCVSAVEEALCSEAGVESATVNFAEHTALVIGEVSADQLIDAVRRAGYSAAELRGKNDESDKEARELAEYRRLWWRALSAGGVGVILFALGFSGSLPSIEQAQVLWIGISVITLVVLSLAGGHFYRGAIASLRAGRGNMDTLVALGTGTAWLYSTLIIIWPSLVPSLARHVYFDAAVIIVALVSLGSALETKARGKTSLAIKRLIGLQPRTASVVRNGKEEELPIEDIGLSETIRIRPGDRIPIDGLVLEGQSHVDEAMLTGESMPVGKKEGDGVFGGTLNKQGSFLMRSTRIGADTVLAGIIESVRQAQSSKQAIGKLVDKVAAIFVPVVVAIAALSFMVWYLYGPSPTIGFAVVSAMTVLVIACPCALGLATPISIMISVGRAAEMGILIRNGDALQRTGQINTIVFDKTGTLTEGKPQFTRLIPTNDYDKAHLFQIAASIEMGSEHPLAQSITTAAQELVVELLPTQNFSAIPGQGVKADVQGQTYYLGNTRLIESLGVDLSPALRHMEHLSEKGETPMLISNQNTVLGVISVADKIREDTPSAIKRFKELGLHLVMLTGDSRKTAVSVAKSLGIDDVVAEVLPDDKKQKIMELQQKGHVVAMIGDGINDAPALAVADVGIAIGSGTDVAIEAADITLMRSSLLSVVNAISLSRATVRNIWQNLFGAFIYNTLGIPLAAGVLYPFFGVLLSPMVAAAAMSLSSVTVVSNALRLRKLKL